MHNTAQENANNDLLQAAHRGKLAEVKRALQKGARINKTDAEGNSALLIAARRGDEKMFAYLIEQKAAVEFWNDAGNDALMEALEARQENIAKRCLTLPFNLAAANEAGKTSYLLAAEKNLPRIMAALQKNGADITVQDKKGTTALMLAAENDGLPRSFVHILMSGKPDLERKDASGRTVLMRELNKGAGATAKVKALLKHGANVAQVDDRYQSVRDIAHKWGMTDLVDEAFEKYDVPHLTEGSTHKVPVRKPITLRKRQL